MHITQTNPYAKFFRTLKESEINEETKIIFNRNTVPEQRVYNAPASDEVAVICYDPLQYPLLFQRGECGWNQGLPKITIGCTQSRPNNMLFRAGRCLQQYIVDMYVKIENTRLDFFRKNQDTTRAELYQGILDTLESGENCAENVGRRVILPPTFLGGPRDMKKRYLNAMSLVQKYGKPDLFITMTCNAAWPEIKEQLSASEEAQNRPQLVARAFRAKLLSLKKKIMEQHIFGEVVALIYVVEFQKRGLPHAHFLIILKPSFRMKCPEDFDKFVSAEIPSESEVHLRKAVLRHMMHGPCGQLNLECQCMKHKGAMGKCKYGYPKKFMDNTSNNSEGYPMYRRRNSVEAAIIRKHKLDNRWVIPYNPYLLALFDCHLNVEVCSTIQAVKDGTLHKKTWFRRKNKLIVTGRLAFVAPAEGERYFLRLLLLHVRGPKSFEDLLTVDGYRCCTFQEAALKLHLLEEDDAVDMCLKEACEIQMPFALRRLFSTVLIFCQPSDPTTLWIKYYKHLSEDFRRQNGKCPDKVRHLTVRVVEQYLEAMGKTLKCFGLEHLDITDALDALIPQECIDCRAMLNPAQQGAFNQIIHHVKHKIPGAFFVDGPGGTGKTFLYNALYAEVRLMGKIVLPTATSGIAASNIPSGRTAHSRFKIPIDLESSLSCDVPKQASMARKENVESLETLLIDLCNPHLPFGGKVVVFGGDFRQIFSVVPHKSQKEVVDASLVSSHLWPGLIRFRLLENIRARQDLLQHEDHGTENVAVDPLIQITSAIFDELQQGTSYPEIFTTKVILTPMNEDVDALNSVVIEKFLGSVIRYKSFDTMLDDNCKVYPAEFINKLCPGGMSPHDLVFKENYPVILLRNILPSFGLCNGTRLVCSRFFPNLIDCNIKTGHHKGDHVFIPRVKFRSSASNDYPFQFQRKQFPIKLSFAMTINKSQGQTLNQVAVYLPQPCFSLGHLYVALSRARKAAQVSLFAAKNSNGLPQTYAKNVVSYEVNKYDKGKSVSRRTHQ
ncbi:hypothetical protein RND81_09G027900 [Saponaria officinalis]|uniref:ATP-dependent DNA helicase n=1 Tax=Saponaria officinalis TaxID=3572 RepID=A0AAW1IHW7_SAPOF